MNSPNSASALRSTPATSPLPVKTTICGQTVAWPTARSIPRPVPATVPVTAAWHHRGARSGFEVVYFGARGDGCQIEGWATAAEDSATWVVEYDVEVDVAWATRSAAPGQLRCAKLIVYGLGGLVVPLALLFWWLRLRTPHTN